MFVWMRGQGLASLSKPQSSTKCFQMLAMVQGKKQYPILSSDAALLHRCCGRQAADITLLCTIFEPLMTPQLLIVALDWTAVCM